MTQAELVSVDAFTLVQPECCRKLVKAGWRFGYCPETKFVWAEHALGGKHSVCEVRAVGRNGFEGVEIGNAIAALLAGFGQSNDA